MELAAAVPVSRRLKHSSTAAELSVSSRAVLVPRFWSPPVSPPLAFTRHAR
jgi:hypothetical protein